ncbi:MAG: RIP metalloprotease RseP [Nitrospirae bacterium CG_4_10_14_3_um_filter_44_29]|nr:RIP metalloprotease RseP [Nitrospirota bacterium]OIO32164.1 MAG: RIP metalloprotease RseP [Nitrospirae bacterium CG1_02_44_142]PIP70902.1 MAG: RIP metalloprotease RseP [Nitrospirae bacterium CG22_combo_CG10-13_8_21_14_all_44_11]PIV40601.1 MAG: RIP metalloprotease RseP [Nitrospirae bacterium CG02_land_8_20_14_3_00_44_33]PIV66611.1 MAG: RIP metalloprotease RseP [Nitrospirae bacterium CG01_land_8_20_14_3_00_44_22]PIW88437.1 MAG: RIP metalloprotease RseP [Nitrospirae bacterium CG_4_8_14_3_um_fi
MTVLSAIVLLGILIFVHELGHFLFAKKLGVRVLKFSLGFGPKLIGRKYGDTEYLVSAVPLGGYVKMLGEESGDEMKEDDKPFAYNYQPVWKRFLIVFAGPVFNLFFAAAIFFFVFLSGVPVPKPYVGKVMENSPAAAAGLMTGDRIAAVSGNTVSGWDDIDASVNKSRGERLLFKIEREGRLIELSVTPEKKTGKNIFGENTEVIDIGIMPLLYPEVGEVMKNTAAEKAGIKKGDRIVEIDSAPIKTWHDMTEIIHGSPEKPLRLKIKRDENFLELTVTPGKKTFKYPDGTEKQIGLIGIGPAGNNVIKKYNPLKAASLGVKRTWDMVVLTVVMVIKLIQRIIPADTLGGPIMIFQMAGQQASLGAMNFFVFMALISINLGVLNLLPIPVLDGGHILFLGIEAVRRKPLSEKVIMTAQKIGLAIIITLTAFAFYNDIVRFISGKTMP